MTAEKVLMVISFTLTLTLVFSTNSNNASKNISNRNEIQPYERTFMKYHHRRKTISLAPSDFEDIPNLNFETERFKRDLSMELDEMTKWPVTDETIEKRSMVESKNNGNSNKISSDKIQKINAQSHTGEVKKAIMPSSASTTQGPKHICLHKYYKVTQSEQISAVVGTHSPSEELDEDIMASDKVDPPSQPYNASLYDGTTALVEDCAHSCYALWMPGDNGSLTILGQGCWQSSSLRSSMLSCAQTRCAGGSSRLPGAYFCCCTGDYCNLRALLVHTDEVTTLPTFVEPPGMSPASVAACASLSVATLLLLVALIVRLCASRKKDRQQDLEKGDAKAPGLDSLGAGLMSVENLTLIEHIGAGKFGSVWRASSGGSPVAVKIYSSAAHWQREVEIYKMLSHPNILKYYGSDTRPTLTESGPRQQLLVLELCQCTLRQRLRSAPLTWRQFADLAHGLASAVACLHTPSSKKPCIVHRDINSNNVLVGADGAARLADLGLACVMHNKSQARPATITEAGTLRYLAPEALEGALDLSGARAALCAVDVFALGLTLWEMLWRTSGAHAQGAPAHALPYQHALGDAPTLTQLQALVSRNKVRPPLPRGPVADMRALGLARDTCDECWDHDAEARLTAVCVEERMLQLRQLLQPTPGLVRGNNLHPHAHDTGENDKNSNVLNDHPCDVTTPLLYSQPHIGRNACLERNTNTNVQTHTELIHKSLKDIADEPVETPRVQNVDDNCLSVARVTNHRHHATDSENSDRLNEIRSIQRPLDYILNDVTRSEERQPKQTNLINDVRIEKPKWNLGRFFGMKTSKSVQPLDTEVKLSRNCNNASHSAKTSLIVNDGKKSNIYGNGRPSNLILADDRGHFESPCTLSPPNRTLSPNMMMESIRSDRIFAFKELPTGNSDDNGPIAPNQIFAVIVPKANQGGQYIELHKTKGSSESIGKNEASISSQSLNKSVSAGNSESEDSTIKKGRLSCDDKIITAIHLNSGNSSRASIEVELHYLNRDQEQNYCSNDESYRSDCSSSLEDENLMLLSENGGSKITMQPMPKLIEDSRKKFQNDILKEAIVTKDFGSVCNKYPSNGYANFDNEFSDPNDKENSFTGDNPVYIAAVKGEISTDIKCEPEQSSPRKSRKRECKSVGDTPRSPKPSLKYLAIKRQHSLEQVSEIFSSSGDLSHLQNPAGRVKTPGDLPVAVRRARRDRLQRSRMLESNRLSLYDDRMMFGNSL